MQYYNFPSPSLWSLSSRLSSTNHGAVIGTLRQSVMVCLVILARLNAEKMQRKYVLSTESHSLPKASAHCCHIVESEC